LNPEDRLAGLLLFFPFYFFSFFSFVFAFQEE